MTEVEEKAISLSNKLKEQYPLLDGMMYTLNELENIISSCDDLSDELMELFGTYFGEIIRGQVPDTRWVNYESAKDIIGELEYGEDINMVLRNKNQCVFPLVKVYKFFKNGPTDSIAAFGPVAAMTLKGNLKESTKANESVDPKGFDENEQKAVERLQSFFANPTYENLLGLQCESILTSAQIKWVLKDLKGTVSMFSPFFECKKVGRGYHSYNPSIIARDWMYKGIKAGTLELAPSRAHLKELLSSSDKIIKERAAWVLTRTMMYFYSMADVEPIYTNSDAPTRVGIAQGFNRQISHEQWYDDNILPAINDYTATHNEKNGAVNLPESLSPYINFIRLGMSDKNKSIKSVSAKSLTTFASEGGAIYSLFKNEVASLLSDNNIDVIRETLPVCEFMLSHGIETKAIEGEMVNIAINHKNGNLRKDAWHALTEQLRNEKMPEEVIVKLLPKLATPDKFNDLNLCFFAQYLLQQGLFEDAVKKYAALGLQEEGSTVFCTRKMKKILKHFG